MSKIKGLIIKDLLQLKSYRKNIIIFMFVFICSSLAFVKNPMSMASVLCFMFAFGCGMFSISAFNYDETSKSDNYILTMPYTRKQIVLSRFIFIIISTLVGVVLGLIASLTIILITTGTININQLITLPFGAFLGISIIEAIQMPCIYKYGAEKGRMQMFPIFAVIALIIGGVFLIFQKMNITVDLSLLNSIPSPMICLLIVIAIGIIYGVSFIISTKIYDKKEF